MSFFKKITETVSKGVSTATEKAQQTVEITKLHTQISGKRKEIERRFARIGEAVYEAYLKKDLSLAEGVVIPECDEISGVRKEIAGLEERIRELRNEKVCECGQEVPYDTKFCPACGHKFPEPVAVPVEVVGIGEASASEGEPEEEAPAGAEDEAIPADAAQVTLVCDCGAELKADTRFCPDCGRQVHSNEQ